MSTKDTSAVREFKTKVAELEQKIADLRVENEGLRSELADLKQEDAQIELINSQVITERDTIAREAETELGRLNSIITQKVEEFERLLKIVTDREPLSDFDAAWAKMGSQGYQYGEEALEQVRFGWFLAQDTLAEWRKEHV